MLGTPDSKKDAKSFIHTYCSACPVKYECNESALEADFFWSVIAGKMPVRFIEAKRSSHPAAKSAWIPKDPPVKPRPGNNMLERGVCATGKHGIESEEDMMGNQCRGCKNFNASKEGQALKALALKKPKAKKGTPTHCKNGHEKIPANGKTVTYSGKFGLPVNMWSCYRCSTEFGVKGGNYQSDKTHCPKGHEYTPAKTYCQPGTNNRQCRACRRVPAHLRIRSRNKKRLAPLPK